MAEPAVAVCGSVHIDLIATAPRLPRRGETLPGQSFAIHPGGKGGNQAIQVARLGLRSLLVSRVGDDPFGRQLRSAHAAAGVDCTYLTVDPVAETGASLVMIGEGGDYASIVVAGAGERLDSGEIDAARPAFAAANVALFQFELPIPTIAHGIEVAHAAGAMVVLNAAPAPEPWQEVPDRLWRGVELLIVNAVEAAMLAGLAVEDATGAMNAADRLRARWKLPNVVVTVGGAGAVVVGENHRRGYKAVPVEVVETVGAGDAFAGVLAGELARGADLATAMPLAVAAGTLAVTRAGAYGALPTLPEIIAFRDQHG